MSNTTVRPGGVPNNGYGGEPPPSDILLKTFRGVASGAAIGKLRCVTPINTGNVEVGVEVLPLDGSPFIGLTMSAVNDGDPVQIAYAGPVHGTIDEWNEATGGGGISTGVTYYASRVTPGLISNTGSSTPGDINLFIGVGLNATTMLVGAPGTPVTVP